MSTSRGRGQRTGRTGSGADTTQPVIDIYARISRLADGSTLKVDDQIEMCRDEIADRGGVVGEVFRDDSLSAWRPGVERPEWKLLMKRLESRASDGVMIYDVTRFSRKILEGERLIAAARDGLLVWSDTGEYDLTTADGRAHFREAMVAAARESDKISERTKRGHIRRIRKGRKNGGARPYAMPGPLPAPPGWEPGDPREQAPVDLVQAERRIVRECYRRLFAGQHLSTVVRDLNLRRVTNVNGNTWTRSGLTRTLLRPALAGLLVHNGAVAGRVAGITPRPDGTSSDADPDALGPVSEAVVTVAEWERLRDAFTARRRGRAPGRVHLLTGLVTCASCGCKLIGVPRRSQGTYPDGAPRREYRCNRDANRPGACGRNHIDARAAEQAVADAVKARLGDPRNAARLAAHAARTAETRTALVAEVEALEASADELAARTAAWGLERVDAAMTPLLARLDVLRGQLAALTAEETPEAATADAARAWRDAEDADDPDTLRAMIRRAFPRLTLHPGGWNDHSPDRFTWDPADQLQAA